MRRLFVALALGLLLGLTVPVLADHVNEPTLPIKGMVLNIYDYPQLETKINNCDGSEVRTWSKARIEPHLSFEAPNGKPDNDGPSEHFRVRVQVSTVTVKNNGDMVSRADWDADWRHQNREPHSNTAQRWEITQSNTYGLQSHLGLWRVDVRVTGDESGRVVEQSCLFRIVAP